MARVLLPLMMVALAAMPAAADPAQVQQFGLVCEPIGTWLPAGWASDVESPNLAVVDADVRPRRTRIVLDGREVGPAGEFDGTPSHLFLEPGPYRLELVLQGYATVRFDLRAEAGCRYAIKHRMDRIRGTAKAPRGPAVAPLRRIYGPVEAAPTISQAAVPTAGRGPDLSLRPGLEEASVASAVTPARPASMVFRIDPAQAAVYLDGAFLATAGELRALELPVAVTAGRHVVEVVAPGVETRRWEVELAAGAALTVENEILGDGTGPK